MMDVGGAGRGGPVVRWASIAAPVDARPVVVGAVRAPVARTVLGVVVVCSSVCGWVLGRSATGRRRPHGAVAAAG